MIRGTIAAIAEVVRSGTTSAVEIVGESCDAAEAAQAALNAFTLIDREGALQRAAVIDARVAAGDDPGPMSGVPIAMKDLIDQQGLPNTLGAAFEPVVPDRDAEVVQRLEGAGAVIIGRTGLHEFAFGFTSENEHFGPVRNPWGPMLSPGGSSGGSAAAVAAGIVPVAVGTDTGGSIRVPAALCGVMGLKVTHARVPLAGVYPLAPSLDTVGPIARSIADLEVSYRVMAADTAPVAHDALDAIRIAVPMQWLHAPMNADVEAAFGQFLSDAVAQGAAVAEIDEPALEVPADLSEGAYVEIADIHHERWELHRDLYGATVASRMELAVTIQPEAERMAEQWAAAANTVLQRVFEQCDVVATPTVGGTRKTIGIDTMEIAGTAIQHRIPLAAWTAPINRLRLPALAVPLPSATAPPPSLQLVGPHRSELSLLAVGRVLEDARLVTVESPRDEPG